MGRSVIGLLRSDYAEQARVAAAIDTRNGSLDELLRVDAVIDFSLPAGTGVLLDWFAKQSGEMPVYVCGTTGLDDVLHGKLHELGRTMRVMHASNFSSGVAAMAAILKFATPMLTALGYAPRMTEVHHVHKLDAPSGTAKSLCRVIRPDNPASLAVTSVREGEVVGKHDVIFSGIADQLVIAHEASDRSLFARGAIDAALWLCEQAGSGSYTMESYFQKRFAG